jgi:hypothetical protein
MDPIKIFKSLNIDHYTVETTKTRNIFKIKCGGNRKEFLDQIETFLHSNEVDFHREIRSYLSSYGHIQIDNNFLLAKPIKGATENLHIKASGLASEGKLEILELFGEKDVECYTFTKGSELIKSIANHLFGNPHISAPIQNTCLHLLNSDELFWEPDVLPSEKNELGKYLGEVLIGQLALEGKLNAPFLKGKAKKFIIPVSSCFSGVDCAIITKNDVVVPISNKFGIGARASFFTNLLPTILAFEKKIPRNATVLKNIVSVAKQFANPERKAKEIVYGYGCKFVLGVDVEDPYQIYRDIVARRISKPTREVIKLISEDRNPLITSMLTKQNNYSSVTGFLCRKFADDLNTSPASLDFLKGLLAKKDFFQANLNITKWNKGIIEYSFTQSGEIDLTIIGDKSSLSDIAAKQGLVNYLIRTL